MKLFYCRNYEIDLANIWGHQNYLFFKGITVGYHARKVVNKIQPLIAEFTEKSDQVTVTKEILEEHEKWEQDLLDKYELKTFFYNDNCYNYERNIIIDRKVESFEYWFSLKLTQYISRLNFLDYFLDYQLLENFDNKADSFSLFLNKNILKYRHELLYSQKLVHFILIWINRNTSEVIAIETLKEDSKHLIEEVTDSPVLIKIYPDYQQIVFSVLQPFFDEADHNSLEILLTGKEINHKIYFQSNANRFSMVFRQLHLNKKIIGKYIETKQWICRYFDYKNIKRGRVGFAQSDVHKILTNESYDIPKTKRIDIPNLDFIKEKSKEI